MPVRIPQADGTVSEHYITFIYQPTRDAEGRIDGVATFGFNVTDLVLARQRAEALSAELLRGEERYRAFVSKSTEGIFRVDISPPLPTSLPEDEQIARIFHDASLAECNDAMARMYGFDSAAQLRAAG